MDDTKINIKMSHPDIGSAPILTENLRERFFKLGKLVGKFMDELTEEQFGIINISIEVKDIT